MKWVKALEKMCFWNCYQDPNTIQRHPTSAKLNFFKFINVNVIDLLILDQALKANQCFLHKWLKIYHEVLIECFVTVCFITFSHYYRNKSKFSLSLTVEKSQKIYITYLRLSCWFTKLTDMKVFSWSTGWSIYFR